MVLSWVAVGTWAATAVGGLLLVFLFLSHGGMKQSEREAIGPLRVFPHVGFAVVGFGFWVAYAISDVDALGWIGLGGIVGAFLIAGTFMLTREQHRRAELASARALLESSASGPGGGAGAGAAGAKASTLQIPAEKYIPIWLAGGHGLLGAATLVLVIIERSGVHVS